MRSAIAMFAFGRPDVASDLAVAVLAVSRPPSVPLEAFASRILLGAVPATTWRPDGANDLAAEALAASPPPSVP